MRNILFAVSEGIGNIFELLPVTTSLECAKGWEISYLICEANYNIGEDVLKRPTYNLDNVDRGFCKQFDGVIATWKGWDRVKKQGKGAGVKLLNNVNNQKLTSVKSWGRSEVDWRLDIARELGVVEDQLKWGYDLGYDNEITDHFHVVMANGYNKNGKEWWRHKAYPKWNDVVQQLYNTAPRFKICSIGATQEEYIPQTVNRTCMPLSKSLALIKNAELLLANDTGVYHASALLKIPSIIAVTFTKLEKIYDSRFHTKASLVYDDMECREFCYDKRIYRGKCRYDYACKNIDVSNFVNLALRKLQI